MLHTHCPRNFIAPRGPVHRMLPEAMVAQQPLSNPSTRCQIQGPAVNPGTRCQFRYPLSNPGIYPLSNPGTRCHFGYVPVFAVAASVGINFAADHLYLSPTGPRAPPLCMYVDRNYRLHYVCISDRCRRCSRGVCPKPGVPQQIIGDDYLQNV